MATHRKPDPERTPLDEVLDEEVAGIFAADPEFKDGLRKTVEQVRNGKAKMISDVEARRRLRRLGVSVDEDADEPPPARSEA